MYPRSLLVTAICLTWLLAGCDGCGDDDDSGSAGDDDTSQADDDAGDDDAADDDSGTGDDDSADDDSADDDTLEDPYVQPAVYVTPLDLMPGGTATIHYYATLAQEDDLTVHYGFNGWNDSEGIEEIVESGQHGDAAYYLEAEMTPVLDGFEVTVELPTDGRAMHFAFFTAADGEEVWDNNDSKDYHQSILFPYIGPLLSWNDAAAPSSGVAIGYETSVPCLGILEYGTTAALGNGVLGAELSQMHHFTLSGLAPDTVYHYRVNDSAGHATEVHTFRTAPASDTSFEFAVLSDMQDTGENSRWTDVAAEVVASHGDVEFLVVAGDMTADDGPGHWWTFFDRGRELFPSLVMMPSPGNHDTPSGAHDADTSSFEGYFDLPMASGYETYYRFAHGSATFLSLNSERAGDFAIGSDQYAWAESELATVTSDWVFAFWHDPPYNAGNRHGENQGLYRDLTQLFDGRVDWVFGGHEHLYQRMLPMRYNGDLAPSGAYGNGPDDGVGYIVLPPAGNNPSSQLVHPESPEAHRRDRVAFPEIEPEQTEADSEIGFVIVQVDGNTITLETWGMGTIDTPVTPYVRDTVSYTK